MRISLLTLALTPIFLTALLAPAPADACTPAFCRAWTSLTFAPPVPIPSQGVLVIPATFGEGFDEPVDTDLGALLVEVTSEGGDIITGALELHLDPLVLVWRPDVPLTPGLYDASIVADNSAFGDEGWCADGPVAASGPFEIIDAPVPAPGAPIVVSDAELVVSNELTLDDLVCCDDAAPYQVECGSPSIHWDTGFCATTLGRANIKGTFTIDPADFEAGGGQVVYSGFAYGESTRTITSADVPCVVTTITNLVSGKSNEGEMVCAGERLADQLGPVDLDPTALLAEQCVGEPYTCAFDVDGWDPSQCQAWPADDTTTGDTTGDTTGTSSTSGGETTAATSGESTGTDDTSATSGGQGEPEVSCACRGDGARPTGLLWLLVAAPLLRGRRRRR